MGDVADLVGPFRAFRTQLRDAFASFAGPYVSIDVLLSWATSRFSSVEVEHAERRSGPSTYSFGKLASLALTMLTGFSTRPLRLASLLGLMSTFLGVVILVYVRRPSGRRGKPLSGVPLPRFDHRDLFGDAAPDARDHRRVPRARPRAHDGSACVHDSAAARFGSQPAGHVDRRARMIR